MSLEVKTVCPLGGVCEQVVEGAIERCAWYVTLAGRNPQTDEMVNDSRCAMAWQPILMIEGNGAVANVNASVQSLRNQTVKKQAEALEVIRGKKAISHT